MMNCRVIMQRATGIRVHVLGIILIPKGEKSESG